MHFICLERSKDVNSCPQIGVLVMKREQQVAAVQRNLGSIKQARTVWLHHPLKATN